MELRLAVVCFALAMLVPSEAMAAANAKAAERAMVEAVNDARRGHGLRALRTSRHLARSAGRRAAKLNELDLFGHLGDVDAAGGFRSLGEALALHRGWRPRAGWTVRRWMRSPSHRAVLLGRYRQVGAGIKRGRFGGRLTTVWVLHVGRR
jgi:uncharacterized protein YkwD